jgi:rubredoxin
MSAVGVNMRLNAPQLSGKSWGDLDIAKAALSEALEQPATPPAAQPAQQEPVVFYRCKGCGHAYENSHPTSCDCMEAKGFDRVDYYTAPPAAPVQKGS